MNEILRDLINKGKVAAFVDDVLVGTETEKEHDYWLKGPYMGRERSLPLIFFLDSYIVEPLPKIHFCEYSLTPHIVN